MDRSRLKGDEGQHIWTEWAILAYNTDARRPNPVKHSEPLFDQSKPIHCTAAEITPRPLSISRVLPRQVT
jgi:hypothetical protein